MGKKPQRSLNTTVNSIVPGLTLNSVPKHHIYTLINAGTVIPWLLWAAYSNVWPHFQWRNFFPNIESKHAKIVKNVTKTSWALQDLSVLVIWFRRVKVAPASGYTLLSGMCMCLRPSFCDPWHWYVQNSHGFVGIARGCRLKETECQWSSLRDVNFVL